MSLDLQNLEVDKESDDNCLTLKVDWEDTSVPMISIECKLSAGAWSAVSWAYTQREQLGEFARALRRFSERCEGIASFEAGTETVGVLNLRVYAYNNSKHIACFVHLSTPAPTEHRAEEISRLSLELYTEASFIDRFIKELEALEIGIGNEARLRVAPLKSRRRS